MQIRKILCALDTGDLDLALSTVRRLSPYVGGFKIGHALTLPFGLGVLDKLREAGAEKIFLDLKFHDIPNSVALAVKEAAKRGVWMTTIHTCGGSEMMRAAVDSKLDGAPLIVGVTVLTSIDQSTLTQELQIASSVGERAFRLAQFAAESGLDGVVCSPNEVKSIRLAIGGDKLIVTPGIRSTVGQVHDQKRTGTPQQALADGADYLVIGRALSESEDVEAALAALGFEPIPPVPSS